MNSYRIVELNMLGVAGAGGFDIFVDDPKQPYAFVVMGRSIQIQLNTNAHDIGIELAGQYKNTLEPKVIHIEANTDNHRFYCKIKRGWVKGTLHVMDYLRAINELFIAVGRKQSDGKIKTYPTFNELVADIYIYKKGNYIENINSKLNDFFELIDILVIDYYSEIGMSYYACIFEMLREIFEHLKAYDQEKLILEGMYKCNIPRTSQQEQRLAFLKKGRNNVPEILTVEKQEDILLFDYRTIKWNIENFNDYIENFTMESKKILTPMVIAEWNKSIQGYKIKWDIDEIKTALTCCMEENFDNQYTLSVKEAGPITEAGCEAETSILITENGNIKYPYIAYLVTGERMTAKQINLSIYALIMPELCSEDSSSIMEFNQKVLEKCKVVVERQNPKLNNTIELMKTIMIEELEKWLQDHYSQDSMYD